MPGKCILCFLTVAKHQAPDADNQGKPQRTGHLYLHMDLRENMFAIEQQALDPHEITNNKNVATLKTHP